MAKGKSTRKYNKLLTARRNYFEYGTESFDHSIDPMESGITFWSEPVIKNHMTSWFTPEFTKPGDVDISGALNRIGNIPNKKSSFLGLDWSNPFKGSNSNNIKNSLTSAAGSAIGTIGGGLIGGGLQSTAGNVLSGLGNIASVIPGPWGAVASTGLKGLSGIANRLFGSKLNEENIAKVQSNINALNAFQSNASDYDTLASNWSSAPTGMTFSNSFIGSDGMFSNKAKRMANRLRDQVSAGDLWVSNNLANNAANIDKNQLGNLLARSAAYGGPIFAKGGTIHINPENKGKFTETKRRTGKTTEELTHSKNPLTRKRAIFAQNAKKWHHAFGGELNTQGGDFTNGIIYIDNGGSHESSPYEGVPMGVDSKGIPNLVEEGEVIYNDYVFSNRLKVPKAVRNKYKLRGNKPLTFADAALQMSKESEERPNDPISQNGLEALLGELAYTQEDIREKKQNKKKYAYGGNLFSGEEDHPSILSYPGGKSAITPYDWANFVYNGIQLYDPTTRQYNPMYNQERFRQFVRDKWDTLGTAYWNDKAKVPNWDSRNPGKIPSLDDLLGVAGKSPGLMYDGPYGNPQAYSDAHNFGLYMLDQYMSQNPAKVQHKIRQGARKDPLDFTGEFEYYEGDRGGYSWNDIIKGHYTSAGSPVYDPKTNTTTYYYDPVKTKTPGKVYFRDSAESEWSGGESQGEANKRGVNWELYGSPHEDEEGNKYYTKLGPGKEMPAFDSWMRYAPIAGSLTGLGLSLSSKPDESGAEAILEASRGAGTYQPIRFNQVGNYLTYNPLDLDYAVNQANAESGAARRAILNSSSGNRAQAIAGILAADNNALNQLGALRRGAAEDNLRQRQLIEDFNRATNEFNSEGFFKADAANQSALAQARDLSLRGTMAAEDIRQRARLARENAIQANLSGLFTSMGNIGQERVARQQMQWMIDNGFAPGYGSDKKSKGGKIKRKKKGLTY